MARDSRVYWDANIFIAYLRDETDKGEAALRAIESMAADATHQRISILTSSMWRFEVLPLDESEDPKFDILKSGFSNEVFTAVAVNERIAELAGKLHRLFPKGESRIAVADAIHLATAIVTKCSTFYTFDKPLLNKNGKLADYDLEIKAPHCDQMPLFDQ